MKKPSRKTLKKKLTDACRILIRHRDKDTCQRCRKKVYGKESHPSHVIPQSSGDRWKWDLTNIKILCPKCHDWWGKYPSEAGRWFDKKFPERNKYLDKKRLEPTLPVKKFQLEELLNEREEQLRRLQR